MNLSAGEAQQFTATVTGTANTGVSWVITPAVGTITASGLYTAPALVTSPQTITVTATSAGDPTKSASANINLTASGFSIAVTPKTVTLNQSQTQQFTATVTGATNTAVNWSISPFNLGGIDGNGLYTAPSTIAGTQTVTVTAAAQADLTKTATATITLSPATTAIGVGTGAPNFAITNLFTEAFYRNGFNALVSLPPSGQVTRISGPSGTFGYRQEFQDVYKTSGVKLALVKQGDGVVPVNEDQPLVFQMLSPLYNYYTSVGVSTAGFPTMDSALCPTFDAVNTCYYDFFTNNYALFAYTNALYTGQNFYIRQNFYLKWTALGGMNGPGRPVDGEISVTSSAGNTATMQSYANGVIYNFTSGVMNGQTWGVVQPIYGLYLSNGGHAGFLGFPTGAETVLASGVHRQQFQGGSIDWNPGSDPQLRLPVAAVSLGAPGAVNNTLPMNYGATVQVAASVFASGSVQLTDRAVSWTTSNSRVVAIQQSGSTATLKAAGGGTALITASSEGKTSKPLTVIVTAQCCQVGEGATSTVQQAFLDAVGRNALSVQVPAAGPVQRVGSGYVQQLQSADPAAPAAYLIAKPDRLGTAFVVTGNILVRYLALGGPGGALGFPVSDATAGGRQLFDGNAALAGNPVRLVGGTVLSKWALLGYETGAAGSPSDDAAQFSTFGANSGDVQPFSGGVIYAATAGPRAGQAYFVSGMILTRYLALDGPAGSLGMPASDEFASGDVRRQNFEGGTIDYTAGASGATDHPAARQPAVLAAPGSVVPGSTVRLAVLGFPSGSTIRVSVTGQPDFLVTANTGAYSWQVPIALTARPGQVAIHAVDAAGTSVADGGYTIRSFADLRVQLVKLQGDAQSGLPGALLAQPLRVALRDSAGNAVAGVPVTFEASPGAQAIPTSGITDQNGQAQTWLRLPPSGGLARVNVSAPSALMPVTFDAVAAATSLQNFPNMQQTGDTPLGNGSASIAQKGALLASTAAILRYHQNRGELPASGGLADPATLNQFLKTLCAADAQGNQVCDGFVGSASGEQVVNLWRVGQFVGGGVDVSIEAAGLDGIRDLIATGYPVLLSLALTADGSPVGGHYVVATGVTQDGALVIQDPNPALGRTGLSEYLQGFTAAGHFWKADLRGAVRLVPRTPPTTAFLAYAPSQADGVAFDIRAAGGTCGRALDLPDAVRTDAPAPGAVSRFVACDGAQPPYQLSAGASGSWQITVTDLAAGGSATALTGSGPAAYKVARPALSLTVTPQDAGIASVVNAATFTPGIAPGGLISIFGAGLTAGGASPAVEIDGSPVPVLAATPFQVNAQVPAETAAGSHTVRVRSPYGTAEKAVEIRAVAPAIFLLSGSRGAIVNYPDNRINTPSAPVARGGVLIVYATGLGAVAAQGGFQMAVEPVTAVLNGQELKPAFAGLAPGFQGLYQINIPVPAATPPGLDLKLAIRQAGQDSNTVLVSVQ